MSIRWDLTLTPLGYELVKEGRLLPLDGSGQILDNNRQKGKIAAFDFE